MHAYIQNRATLIFGSNTTQQLCDFHDSYFQVLINFTSQCACIQRHETFKIKQLSYMEITQRHIRQSLISWFQPQLLSSDFATCLQHTVSVPFRTEIFRKIQNSDLQFINFYIIVLSKKYWTHFIYLRKRYYRQRSVCAPIKILYL